MNRPLAVIRTIVRIHNDGSQKIEVSVLVYRHSSQNFEKSNKLAIKLPVSSCWFFHKNCQFFDSDFFKKPELLVF
jgi:hypothetical protein